MTEQEPRKSNNRLLLLLIVVIVVVISLGIAYWLNQPSTLPITRVEVEGAPQVYQQQVKRTVEPLLNEGLITQKLTPIVNSLSQIPWVAFVEVQRKWPNALFITLAPQHIVAIWNKDYLLNDYAETFPLTMRLAQQENLPQFHGPQGKALEVYDYYQQFSRVLLPINLQIAQITLRADGDWSMVLNNGLKIVLGQEDILTRLQRFVKVYDKVFASKAKRAEEVDLQYPNGMAVRWGSN